MKTTMMSKEKNLAKFTIEFSAEEFEAAIVKAYQATKQNYAIDGFRKGKAPRKLIETHYGEGVFFEDALDDLMQTGYISAIQELALDVIDRPAVDFSELKKGEAVTLTIEVECYPEIDIKDYKGLEIDKIEHKVTDEDLDNEMQALVKRNSRMVTVDRPAQNGDTVILDYAGFVGEEQFEGGTAESFSLKLGSGMFIPGFEEQLVGVASNEEKDVKVTFPEEYQAEHLAGAEAIFKCKVHEIKEEQFPELDDEFAKDVSEFDTLEELRESTRKDLEKAAAAKSLNEMKSAAVEKMYDLNDFDAPRAMIEDEIDVRMNEFQQQLGYQGVSLEQYCQFAGKELNELRDEIRPDCDRAVKTRMLLSALADKEEIKAEQEDIDKELDLIAIQYRMEKEKIKEMIGPEYISMIEKDVKVRKAIDFMYDNAVIK
ncbi:MAG: trigger factor [Eubacteriales bacterium]|nr:trigger factor [Eubacteriales bacterium]MDD4390987.1 trigger factor [Eubacteriales bacterium]